MKPKITRELTDAEVVGALLDNINALMGENQVLRESRDALVAREQDMRVLNEQLKAELAAEKARADRAEAACAYYEDCIRDWIANGFICDNPHNPIIRTDCGTGWVSPEAKAKESGTCMKAFSCFKCGDGNTPLYCLNCADSLIETELAAEKARAEKAEKAVEKVQLQLAGEWARAQQMQERADRAEAACGAVLHSIRKEGMVSDHSDEVQLLLDVVGQRRTEVDAQRMLQHKLQLLTRAEKAEDAVAEMRSTNSDIIRLLLFLANDIHYSDKEEEARAQTPIVQMLSRLKRLESTSCGTGFLSPDAKKVRGLLEPILRNGEVAPHSDTATRVAQAVALLDQK